MFFIPVIVCYGYAPSVAHSTNYYLLYIQPLKIKKTFLHVTNVFRPHAEAMQQFSRFFSSKLWLSLLYTSHSLFEPCGTYCRIDPLSRLCLRIGGQHSHTGHRATATTWGSFQCKCWLQIDGSPSGDGRKDGHGYIPSAIRELLHGTVMGTYI